MLHEMPSFDTELHNPFASWFYICQCAACLLWWVLVFFSTRRPIWSHVHGSVFTRPPYLSVCLMQLLRRHSLVIFVLVPSSMLIAAANADYLIFRLTAAICFSLYHLLETSASNRHGEYPLLHSLWGLVLPPSLAHPICMGAIVNFVLSAGLAKLRMPNVSSDWIKPDTMRVYLQAYRYSRSMPPLVPRFTDLLLDRPWALSFLAASTIVAEVILVPLIALFAPLPYRILSAWIMIFMHLGIAAVQSFRLALIFCTTLPLYFFAFSCGAVVGSSAWILAAAIALQPCIFVVRETWPLSPVHLFMWSGKQARTLSRLLMLGDTRLVLGVSHCTAETVIGCAVRPHGLLLADHSCSDEAKLPEVHDAVMRVIGFTLLQGDIDVHRAFLTLLASGADNASLRSSRVILSDSELAAIRVCAASLQRWLSLNTRLVEARSGLPLSKVLFVRVGNDGRVAEVLHAPACSRS